MWIQTLNRAVSIVAVRESSPEGQVQIRGRLRSDIEGLVKGAEILRTPAADYRYRIIVPRDVAEEVLLRLLKEVVYHNFKEQVYSLPEERARYYTYSKIHHLIEENLSEPGEAWNEREEEGEFFYQHSGEPLEKSLDSWIRRHVHDDRKLRSLESEGSQKLTVRKPRSRKARKAKRLGRGKEKQTSSK